MNYRKLYHITSSQIELVTSYIARGVGAISYLSESEVHKLRKFPFQQLSLIEL